MRLWSTMSIDLHLEAFCQCHRRTKCSNRSRLKKTPPRFHARACRYASLARRQLQLLRGRSRNDTVSWYFWHLITSNISYSLTEPRLKNSHEPCEFIILKDFNQREYLAGPCNKWRTENLAVQTTGWPPLIEIKASVAILTVYFFVQIFSFHTFIRIET